MGATAGDRFVPPYGGNMFRCKDLIEGAMIQDWVRRMQIAR